jgi:endogenous inhibitor of DNA gyrase (YacG/DUF329 family)
MTPVTAEIPTATPRPICCAWCRRIRLGGGWSDERADPGLDERDASYGICPPCAARVRATYLAQNV